MWVDHETDEDLVNFSGIAATITELIMTPHLTPLTIGVHGSWGYGKSSVLRMVEKNLKDRKNVLTLYFNGWAFEGFEDAKIALMDSIISELARNRTAFAKASDSLAKLAKRVRWFKVARKLATVAITLSTGVPDLSGLAETALSGGEKDDEGWLKEAEADAAYRHIHDFREEFAEFLARAEIDRLVIFVDDLDRCLPEDAIATLEAIRLFLSVKGSTFVIGADETMIEYAVRRHFPDLAQSATGIVSTRATNFTKNYLEKLIQLPFRLPQLTIAETRRYITLLLIQDALRPNPAAFAAVLESVRKADREPWTEPDLGALVDQGITGIEVEHATRELIKERLRLAAQIARPLADRYVGNPRQVKRFLNTLTLRLAVAKAYGVEQSVAMAALAKLMVLERRNVDGYDSLSAAVAKSKNGKVADLLELENLSRGSAGVTDAQMETFFGKGGLEQLREWLLIDPEIGNDDLRPYLFVSRERLVEFVGGDSMPVELQELAEILASGNAVAAAGIAARLDALNRDQAGSIAEWLFDRVRELNDLSQQPVEFRTFARLSHAHPELQVLFVRFFQTLPVAQLGAWAATRLTAVASDESSRPAAAELLRVWEKGDNPALAVAAKAALGMM
jgi:predicted KAP-like P-loop ATPase